MKRGGTLIEIHVLLCLIPQATRGSTQPKAAESVSGRRGNWGRTVPLCGFTAGHSFSDMQGTNQEPGLLGFSACKHRMKFTWSCCGNCVPVDVQLIRAQRFSRSKMAKPYQLSSHKNKISLCIPPNWDQTVTPRCANNLPSILVTNSFSLPNTETAKHSIFKLKKKENSFCKERPPTIPAASIKSACVLWLSPRPCTALCWCCCLRSTGYFSRKLCTGAIPTPERVWKETFFDFNSPFLNS